MSRLGAAERQVALESAFLSGTSDQAMEDALAAASVRSWDAGQVLFRQGEPASRLHLVLSGMVKVWKVTPSGAPVTIHQMAPGQVIGCVAVFCGMPLPATATARDPVRTLAWPAGSVSALLAKHPDLKSNALAIVGSRTVDMLQRVEELATEPADVRIARALLRTAAGAEGGIARLSRQDLADMTATTLHTVSRAISRWERSGWVVGGRRRITVLAPDALRGTLPERN